jgi:hypothetical protein
MALMGIFIWLKGYLAIWKQRVFIKDAISSTGELKAGVPQVSVVGPLLFLILVNDVADTMTGFGRLLVVDTCIGHTARRFTYFNKYRFRIFKCMVM